MSDLWDNIDRDIKKRIISACIFAVFMVVLFIGICLTPSYFAIPFCVLGVIGLLVGTIGLIAGFIEWWEQS
jgi:hypothetical protein